jgi:hypothetical protein
VVIEPAAAATDMPAAAPSAPLGTPIDASASGMLGDMRFVTAPHRAWPVLAAETGGAHVLRPMKLVTLVAANDDSASSLFAFSDAAIASKWWHAMGDEYGAGAPAESVHVTVPAIDHDLLAPEITAIIDTARTNGSAPAPNGNTLYLLYVPAPYAATGASSTAYHDAYPKGAAALGDGYAVVSRANAETGESILDELTERASHEIMEAVTDTSAGWRLPRASSTPWNDANSSIWSAVQPGVIENGDLCELSRIREKGFLYQRGWSNKAAALGGDPCVPALAEPYFNVTVADDWFEIEPGGSSKIPFTGWSTAAAADWQVNVGPNHGSGALAELTPGPSLTITTTRGVGTAHKCGARQGVNNGVTGTITVTAPAQAKSGDFVVLWIRSFREDATTCDPLPDSDFTHFWPVGVHVR